MRVLLTSLICLLLALSTSLAADDARLAYIINIEEYERPAGPVKRKSGADTMADALARFGYTVQRYNNINKWEFEAVLKEIYADSKGAEAAIVYVSSFALNKGQRNVVLPADALSGGADKLLSLAVEAKDVVNAPQARLLNMIILDAPEDARAAFGLTGSGEFGVFMSTQDPFVPNRLAVYTSTAPNNLYIRLAPMNTPLTYARNFKLFLGRKERTAVEFLRKVSVSVFYDSSNLQFPTVVGKLNKPYMLVRKNEVSDITAWLKIQAKPKTESFEQFIRQFPKSIYIPFARQRLKELSAQ
ncbi:MAG: caspase family protein [Alphaproteobacteria bacterium]|nr:caspase family protein [Alphaproteobacteria bacterium]